MSAASDTATIAAAWATGAGALFTAVSAGGTWLAAIAARNTSQQTNELANRASRALARTARPRVHPMVWDLPDPGLQTEEAHTMRFGVRNASEFMAHNVRIEIDRADELTAPKAVLGPIDVIGPNQQSEMFPVAVPWPYGKRNVDPPENDAGGEIVRVALTYWDLNDFVHWRQVRLRLMCGIVGGPGDRNLTVMRDELSYSAEEIDWPGRS